MTKPLEPAPVGVWTPSRRFRREADGKRCVACPNRLHFADVVCISHPDHGVVFIHESCALMLAERMAAETSEAGQ